MNAPVWKVLPAMDDSVKTLMSVKPLTFAPLLRLASTLLGHITVTVAVASSLITPSVRMWMSVRWATAAHLQTAQIHLVSSPVSVQQGTGEMVSPVQTLMSAHWPDSATQMLFALTFLALITALVRWVILEMA